MSAGDAAAVAATPMRRCANREGVRRRQLDQLFPLGRNGSRNRDLLLDQNPRHRLRAPRLRCEHERGAIGQLLPHLGHVAGVRERRRHQSSLVTPAHRTGRGDRCGKAGMVKPRALRMARRPARPDDDRWSICGSRPPDRRHRMAGAGVGQLVAVHHREARRRRKAG